MRRTFDQQETRTLFVPLVPDVAHTCGACGEPADDGVTLGVGTFDEFFADDPLGAVDRIVRRVPGCRPCADALAADDEHGLRERLAATSAERAMRRARGLHFERIAPDRRLTHENAVREAIFAAAWEREQGRHYGRTLLDQFAHVGCDPDDPGAYRSLGNVFTPGHSRALLEGGATARDEIIAATVAQWLGTNVGFAWLGTVLHECGYTLIPDRSRIPRTRPPVIVGADVDVEARDLVAAAAG